MNEISLLTCKEIKKKMQNDLKTAIASPAVVNEVYGSISKLITISNQFKLTETMFPLTQENIKKLLYELNEKIDIDNMRLLIITWQPQIVDAFTMFSDECKYSELSHVVISDPQNHYPLESLLDVFSNIMWAFEGSPNPTFPRVVPGSKNIVNIIEAFSKDIRKGFSNEEKLNITKWWYGLNELCKFAITISNCVQELNGRVSDFIMDQTTFAY